MGRTEKITRIFFIVASIGIQGGQAMAETSLGEINVTATRVEKQLQNVPASVGVVDQDDIQFTTQQIGLDESLVKMPGIFMQNRYNFSQDLRLSIRGFGARSSFGIRGIKVLVDGIPESLPDGQANVDSIDIGSSERIEVIRGPVSSLYGNASGGAVIIQSESAPETPFISIRPSFGEDGFQKHQLKFGGQKNKFDYLVNISDLDYDGYRDHNRTEMTQVNSKFGYQINDHSKLTTILNYADSPLAEDPGGLTAAQVEDDPTQARDKNVRVNAGEELDQTRLGFVYEKDFGESDKLVLRNYYVWRDFANRIPAGPNGESVGLDRFVVGGGAQYTHESSFSGRNNRLTVGIDLDKQDDDRTRFDLAAGAVLGNQTQDQNEEVTSVGVYVQDELALTDKFELTLGGRYDRLEFDVSDKFLSDGDDSGDRTFDQFSPSIGLRFSPKETLSFYTSLSRSFETPTARELGNPTGGGFNQQLDPQTANNYEVGVKGQIGQRNRYEIALYRIDVKDELIPFDADGETFFENAGESKRQGIEILFETRPIDGLTASLAYTYSDFEFKEFMDDNGNDFSGKTIPGVPENLLHFDISYQHQSGLYGSFDVLYADEIFANNANTATSDAYTVANLRLGYTGYFGNWEFSPFLGVNNLFDEDYNGNVRINAFGARYFEPAPDQNAYGGFTLRYNFASS
ncbi:MAG TPA: TonB-dependent receptor [Chromatiales bacterium]|nr:TonB-dependent receptor [Thiotrichales bacterium]HIP68915.1 TonB-dependent receptor [Chromatiales bacterium]